MTKLLRYLIAPIASLIILIMGNAFFFTFTSLRLKLEGHSIEVIGYTTAAYFAGLLVGSFRCNRFIERVGHIRAYSTFAALLAVVTMVQAIFLDIWVWIPVRFSVGFFMAGLFVVIESWLLSKSTISTKGKILSVYMICYFASQSVGQFLLNLSDPMSMFPFAIIVILSAISIVPICMTKIAAPIISETSYLNVFKLFKISPLGVFGCIFSGLISGAIYGLTPIYVKDLGFSIKELAQAMGIIIFGGLVLQWPLGQLSDHFDRRKVLFIIAVFTALFATIISVNSIYSFTYMVIFLAILAGFSFAIYPVSITHASDSVDSKDLIAATAGLALVYSFGAIFGPIVASYSMDLFGPKGLFLYITIISITFGFFAIYYIVKKIPIPKEEKVHYRNMPRTKTLASELDPRTKEKKGE